MIIQYTGSLNKIKTQWLNNRRPEIISDPYEEIFQMQDSCYHYTTLEAFWKIINSEIFRATHVRFSNDMQEYEYGEEIIGQIIEKGSLRKDNYYVVCFCSEGDLLSQWREYGKMGVSIKMDFKRKSLFTINRSNKSADDKLVFSCPVNVLYINKESLQEADKFCRNEKSVFTLEELIKTYKESPAFGRDEQLRNLIPYIKHGAFIEEKESRLLFSMPPSEEYQEMNYVYYTDPMPWAKPYLEVKCGNVEESKKPCTYIHVAYKAGFCDIKNAIENWVIDYNKSNSDKLTFKSHALNKEEDNKEDNIDIQIYISAGDNQEKLFYDIEAVCSEHDINLKIWCDGHWPIRSIMVGPTLDKHLIKESIEHYCKSKSWLKYVDIKTTNTPYREKRNL